jgi:meso-butanediol dehydrogenase / (S,S)-butanediol dehydrogenase / diacetyl reductase
MRALVTGAGSGVGAEAARRLADDGFDVTVCDLDPWAIAEELGATGVVLDVRDEAQVAKAMDGVEVLVNAATATSPGPTVETPVAVWNELFAVNARGAFLCCKHAIAGMRARGRGGVVVNVLTASAAAPHAASQGAVAALTRALAIEHGAENIRVNAVYAAATDADAADAVVYLATAEFVTGTVLTVDGGSTTAAFGAL